MNANRARPSTATRVVRRPKRWRWHLAASRDRNGAVKCLPGEDNRWRMRVDSATDWAFQPGSPVSINLRSWIYDGFNSVEERGKFTVTPTNVPNARTHR